MEVRIDKEKIVKRKLDSKGRVSLNELADPGDEVEIAFLENHSESSDNTS